MFSYFVPRIGICWFMSNMTFASNHDSILKVGGCIICTPFGHPPQKQIGRNSATSWDSLPPSIDLWLDTIKVVIIDLWCMVGY